MPNSYDKGDLVRIDGTFKNASTEAELDPTTVKFTFKKPDGTTTTYVFGTNAELVQDDTGEYHVDLDLDQAGRWYYRMFSEGTGQTAAEGSLHVREPNA